MRNKLTVPLFAMLLLAAAQSAVAQTDGSSNVEQRVYKFGGVVLDSPTEKRAAKKAWIVAEYVSAPVEPDEAARLASEEVVAQQGSVNLRTVSNGN